MTICLSRDRVLVVVVVVELAVVVVVEMAVLVEEGSCTTLALKFSRSSPEAIQGKFMWIILRLRH